jgi:uncharacterized protein RhaS with RHS repeats
MGLYTQQDPIGIAGGLNLYGYANGDPINFSDPFGLCPDEEDRRPDDICEELVEQLSALEGDVFQDAARLLDGYSGNVIMRPDWPGDQASTSARFMQLGTGASMTQMGLIPAGSADLLMLAVHETGHLGGIGSEYGSGAAQMNNFQALLAREREAFTQLGPLNYQAPLAYLRLNYYGKNVNFYRPLAPR